MIDLRDVTEPIDPVFSHCHKPMRWAGVSMTWEGQLGSGWEISRARWDCACGATLTAEIRVPS
jgi:hypothetical protein